VRVLEQEEWEKELEEAWEEAWEEEWDFHTFCFYMKDHCSTQKKESTHCLR
jgi:hypothetical protein